MMYGAQIYLKEYSMLSNHAYYRLEENEEKIDELKNLVTDLLREDYTITPAAQLVMDLYKEQIDKTARKTYLHIEGKQFKADDFDRCINGALIWGYFFAQEMTKEAM